MKALLADDHSIVRTALKYILSDLDGSLDVVEARDVDEIFQSISANQNQFDIVMMDLRMPGMEDGDDTISKVVQMVKPAPVCVFSVSEDPDEMRKVLADGVQAYIPKTTDDNLIATILRLVISGGSYVPPVLGQAAQASDFVNSSDMGSSSSKPMSEMDILTRRQREVLGLLAQGLSNQEICDELDLNLSTVKSHVTAILRSLKVDNRTQAVLKYQQNQ